MPEAQRLIFSSLSLGEKIDPLLQTVFKSEILLRGSGDPDERSGKDWVRRRWDPVSSESIVGFSRQLRHGTHKLDWVSRAVTLLGWRSKLAGKNWVEVVGVAPRVGRQARRTKARCRLSSSIKRFTKGLICSAWLDQGGRRLWLKMKSSVELLESPSEYSSSESQEAINCKNYIVIRLCQHFAGYSLGRH